MALIVVAGTENATIGNLKTVSVVDVSNPAAAVPTPLDPQIGLTGARVSIDAGLLAVGSVLGGTVKTFDVTKPATPAARGSVATPLAGGIGALAVRGTLVAAGEWTSSVGARVALIDASGNTPAVVSTAKTSLIGNAVPGGNDDPLMSTAAITSVAFLSDARVIAASPTSGQIFLVDFSNRMTPVVTAKNTTFASIGSADADADAQQIAAGDGAGGQVKLFDATFSTVQTVNTQLGGVGSLSLSAPLAIAGSPNDFNVALIDFTASSVTRFGAQVAGGATAVMRDHFIALGSILGPFGSSLGRIQFFDATATAAPLGHADVGLASISTITIGQTTDVSVSPSPLDFGVIAATTAVTRTIAVRNTGSVVRHVTAAAITGATGSGTFAIVPPSPSLPITLAANGGTATLTIRYTGGSAVGPASASLRLTTDDPAAPTIAVPLAGRVGRAVAVLAGSTSFGTLAACLTKDLSFTLTNTGDLPLTVTAITVAGDARLSLAAPAPAPTAATPLVVLPGATASLTVRFSPAGTLGAIPAAASLTLTCNDPAAPALSFAGTAVPAPADLSVSATSLAFGTVPVNSVVALTLTLANRSPCAALTATLSTAAPFSVEASAAATGLTLTGALTQTVTINPGLAASLAIAFAPPAVGAAAGTLTITSNDPAKPTVTIPMSGGAAAAPPTALELVLDRSGSMADPVPGGTKMTSLQQTVQLFASVIPFNNGDELGVVAFDTVADVLTPRATWTAMQQSTVTTDVNALLPQQSTSIGAGLEFGRTELAGTAVTRRATLVFTDGMENTPPLIAAILPGITQAGIEVYAVGLGRPADISTAALSNLAVDSKGKFFTTDDALVLRKQFLQVLADSFRQNVAADPVATVQSHDVAELPVNLTDCDRSATFAASWDDPSSSMVVTLVTPQGAVLTPSSPAANELVEFGQDATYAWYRVRFAPLDPGSGQFMAPAPAGLWSLQVSPANLAGTSERVALSALVESELTLAVDIRASDTASPITIDASLLEDGTPVTGASVEARVRSPIASLAAASTPTVVARARAADQLSRPMRPARSRRRPTTINMTYSPRTGRYTTQVPAPVDGVYQIEIVATGSACGGTFDRYAAYAVYVSPRLSGSTPIGVTPVTPGTGIVTVTPTAASGQPLGPGFAHLIDVTVSGKGFASEPVDLGDGTYAFRVYWNPRGKKPTATVMMAGRRRTVSLLKRRKPAGRRGASSAAKPDKS